jgi:cob(I)alamin adenosyltransferase
LEARKGNWPGRRPVWPSTIRKDELMAEIKHLIEEWIQIRATLQRQVKMLESGELHTGTNFPDRTTQETITRLKGWINELNALLKEFSRTYAI